MHSTTAQRESLFDPDFVRQLFDEMSATYGIVNTITSFGFCWRWRRQCIECIPIAEGSVVIDLMTGMGELLGGLAKRIGPSGHVTALDLSPRMCDKAKAQAGRHGRIPIKVIEADVLRNSLHSDSADVIVSTFGLKTFSREQQIILAREIARVLKPGGKFSLLEISVPGSAWLRPLYMFYLNRVIPILGQILLGNPDNYRHLGVYTTSFGSCDGFLAIMQDAGLRADTKSFFFGCATGVFGEKPDHPNTVLPESSFAPP